MRSWNRIHWRWIRQLPDPSDHWKTERYVGIREEAKRLVTIKEGFTVTRLLSKSLAGEKIEFGEETYDAVWLLSQFIQMSLQTFPVIDGIVFTVPSLTEELAQMLRGIAVRMNIDKRHIFIQDYKEVFATIFSTSPKNSGSMTQRFSAATEMRSRHICCGVFARGLAEGRLLLSPWMKWQARI